MHVGFRPIAHVIDEGDLRAQEILKAVLAVEEHTELRGPLGGWLNLGLGSGIDRAREAHEECPHEMVDEEIPALHANGYDAEGDSAAGIDGPGITLHSPLMSLRMQRSI